MEGRRTERNGAAKRRQRDFFVCGYFLVSLRFPGDGEQERGSMRERRERVRDREG